METRRRSRRDNCLQLRVARSRGHALHGDEMPGGSGRRLLQLEMPGRRCGLLEKSVPGGGRCCLAL